MTDSLSSPPWASRGLLHEFISSFHSQISVPRFLTDFRFKPTDHGAESTWTFSSWLARGRACVGIVNSPSLETSCCKVISRPGSPLLPGCRKWGTWPAIPRAFPRSWGDTPGKGLDLGLTWLAQDDSLPHCSCKSGSVRERTNSKDPQQACACGLVVVWGARHPFPAQTPLPVSSFNCVDVLAASDGLWEILNIGEFWGLIWWPAHREVATQFVQQVPPHFRVPGNQWGNSSWMPQILYPPCCPSLQVLLVVIFLFVSKVVSLCSVMSWIRIC